MTPGHNLSGEEPSEQDTTEAYLENPALRSSPPPMMSFKPFHEMSVSLASLIFSRIFSVPSTLLFSSSSDPKRLIHLSQIITYGQEQSVTSFCFFSRNAALELAGNLAGN